MGPQDVPTNNEPDGQRKTTETQPKPIYLLPLPVGSAERNRATSISAVENNPNRTFNVNFAAITSTVDLMFNHLISQDHDRSKLLTLGAVEYYCGCMAWFKILRLKYVNSQPLTDVEMQIYRMAEHFSFVIPQPIFMYLRNIGNITTPLGDHLIPEFPPLPTQVVDNVPGTLGNINEHNHNIYEEVSVIGVLCEYLMHEVSEQCDGV